MYVIGIPAVVKLYEKADHEASYQVLKYPF